MHWVSWKKICRSKEDGGVGFKDIGYFNQAILVKQAWRLLSVPNSLLSWVYKAWYFDKKDFMEAGKSQRPTYAWPRILHGHDLLRTYEIYMRWL